MKKTATLLSAAAAAIGIGFAAAPVASAENDVTTTTFGGSAGLTNGDVLQAWTVTGLKPSSDAIPYTPQGQLWEATATDVAVSGDVQPIISNFNARAKDGTTYRVLFGVPSAQGVNPEPLVEGEQVSGKLFFDVTGPSPDSVVYNAAGTDLLLWLPPPPSATGGGGTAWTPGYSSAAPGVAGAAEATPGEATDATDAAEGDAAAEGASELGSEGTPVATGTEGAAAGSEGTPATAGGEGTPATAGGEGTAVANTPAATAPTTATAPDGAGGQPAVTAPDSSEGTPAVVVPAPAP